MKLNSFMRAFSSSMLILVPIMSVQAVPLTPDQALQRIQSSTTMSKIPGKTSSFELAHTEDFEGNAMLFVFNRGDNGFVIASADDVLPPVLGYSDCGAYNASDASPELKWWLSQYAGEASYYLLHPSETSSAPVQKKAARADRPDIPELLSTRWDQDAPYNLLCPEDGIGRCMTGCVATAMAQLIRYHAYPVQGLGQHSYSWNGQTLSFDYANTVFDYQDMLDSYDDSASYEQKQAVAELMYACGVSVNMSYSSDESGAFDMYIPYALKTFFNYDDSTRLLKRSYFTNEEWEDIVYGELADHRPVIYGGQTPDGGHEFVCDGYENGYYHINWGWAGMGNGYFLLSALDPGLQGIGGFNGGYNTNQSIICGAKPGKGDGNAWYPIYSNGTMEVAQVYPGNSMVYVKFQNGGIYNFSPEPTTLSFCLKIVSESGDEYLPDALTDLSFRGAENQNALGFKGINVTIPSGLEAGNYKAYLVFKTPEGSWQDVMFPLTLPSYLTLTVGSDGSYSFAKGNPVLKAKIKVTEFAPASTVLSGVPTNFDFIVENIGEIEFSNAICVKVFEKGSHDKALAENRIQLNLAPGEVFYGYLSLTYTLADGEYDLIVFDNYDEIVSEVFALRIGEPPVGVERIVLDVTDAAMDVDDTLQLTATVLPENADDKGLIWSSSNAEIANVDHTGLVTAFTSGKVIITVTSASNEDISASCQITVKDKVIEATGITLDKTEATLTEGETLTLTATVEPDESTDKTLTWTSSDEEVATVENGIVTALKPGTVTITVTTSNGKTAQCEITVIEKEPETIYVSSVTLDQTEIEAVEGSVFTLVATVLPEDATDKTLLWSSSDEEIASVDQSGTVTILGIGTAVITAEATDGSEIKAECHITGTTFVDLIENYSVKVDVYTLGGLLIKSNADSRFISKLVKGAYIIRIGGVAHKIVL